MNLVVGVDMAWVTYDQIGDMSGEFGELGEMAGQYHELKILHKVRGIWKLVCVIGSQVRVDHVRTPLIEVGLNGSILWMNDAAKGRLPNHPMLGRRAGRLQASETEAHGTLMAALEWAANKRDRHSLCDGNDAVTCAVALGKDDAGLAHICWAILRDGKLLVAFDDDGRLDRQLSCAAAVYGLSAAQERVARLLVGGREVAEIADGLGVSPNTAKTHLQRIYDKTGVRAQPALVRLLLNADGGGV